MNHGVIENIRNELSREKVVMGAASAEALNATAPEGFRPKDIMPAAKTVLVFARPLPLTLFQVPAGNHAFYQRSSYIHYLMMDKLTNDLSLMIQQAGYRALPVPSYSPLRFHQGEPRGIISLKHAAVYAGLGKMGRNTLLIHREHGNVMRLGALATDMEWPQYPLLTKKSFCPDNCRLCEEACPVGALKDGTIDKMKCMGHCIRHVLLPPKFMLPLMKRTVAASKLMTKFMELISLNFFETYAIGCSACLRVCIHFHGNKH